MTIHNVAGFDWDHGNLKKCQKHGVEIAEIESVFRQTMAVFPDPTHSQGEDRFIGIGKTHQGRRVFIAFTLRTHSDDVLIRPISARYMHQKEVEHYEKEISKT
ncbi:BrnT family toxin [Methylobacter sp.]|uniref:BrnT family toxin n=1 Tax=Methylobacter sp. TaxID=2051955 RepID=UPI001205ADDD|nr:BrnT family toxin [Methylobacter sp.]TAK63908.1 MAG: BrnT family toxin [Methylobacter sp.]